MSIAAFVAAIKSAWDVFMGFFDAKKRLHRQAVEDAARILRDRANVLLTNTNHPSLPRSEWASLLPDPSLINEALQAAGAEREWGKEDRWIIDPRKKVGDTIDRFRPTRLGG